MGQLHRPIANNSGELQEVVAGCAHCSTHTEEDSRSFPFLNLNSIRVNKKSFKAFVSTWADVMQYNLGSIFRRDSIKHLTQMGSRVIRSVCAEDIGGLTFLYLTQNISTGSLFSLLYLIQKLLILQKHLLIENRGLFLFA